MELVITLALIVAGTLAIGLVVRRFEQRNKKGLSPEQLEVLQDVVDRMRKQRTDRGHKD